MFSMDVKLAKANFRGEQFTFVFPECIKKVVLAVVRYQGLSGPNGLTCKFVIYMLLLHVTNPSACIFHTSLFNV